MYPSDNDYRKVVFDYFFLKVEITKRETYRYMYIYMKAKSIAFICNRYLTL